MYHEMIMVVIKECASLCSHVAAYMCINQLVCNSVTPMYFLSQCHSYVFACVCIYVAHMYVLSFSSSGGRWIGGAILHTVPI